MSESDKTEKKSITREILVNKYNRGLKSVRCSKYHWCMPNLTTDILEKYDDDGFNKKYRRQLDSEIRRYGFTNCETWCLEYTTYVWLYEHIKFLLDRPGKIIDYDCDAEECWDEKTFGELEDAGVDTKIYHSDKAVLEYICDLIEKADAIAYDGGSNEEYHNLIARAFRVFGIIAYRAGW